MWYVGNAAPYKNYSFLLSLSYFGESCTCTTIYHSMTSYYYYYYTQHSITKQCLNYWNHFLIYERDTH